MTGFFKRLHQASRYSIHGLHKAWLTQWAFRVELIALLIAIPCAMMLSRSSVDFILLIGSILLVMMMELLNTAIETTVNRISTEQHELSGLAKDFASAAIFVASINALMIWIVILVTF